MDNKTEVDIHKDIAFIKARLDHVIHFVEAHMAEEERKFDKIENNIAKLSKGFLVLLFVIMLEAFGVPISSMIPKLLTFL